MSPRTPATSISRKGSKKAGSKKPKGGSGEDVSRPVRGATLDGNLSEPAPARVIAAVVEPSESGPARERKLSYDSADEDKVQALPREMPGKPKSSSPSRKRRVADSTEKSNLQLPKGALQTAKKGDLILTPRGQDLGVDPLESQPVAFSMVKGRASQFDPEPLTDGGDSVPSWTRTLKGPQPLKFDVGSGATDDESDSSCEETLTLPENSAVLTQLMDKPNNGLTFLDVALALVADLQEQLPKRKDELRYIRDCLSQPDKTTIPCALCSKQATLKTVRLSCAQNPPSAKSGWKTPLVRGALRAARQGSNPPKTEQKEATPALQAVTNQLRKSCPFMGPPLPQWPTDSLDSGVESKLEKILKSEFNTWAFDLFDFAKLTQGRPLLFVGWEALCRGSCFSEFALDPQKARCFFKECEALYGGLEDTPYHNNYHAADVTQTAHTLMLDIGIGVYCDPMDVMGLVLAAAIHDAGHDGRSNAFHAALQDNLALTYNDKSILENFHVSQGFKLLKRNPEANFVGSLPQEQFKILRREVISMVLGTDMAFHFSEVAEFQQLYEKLGRDPGAWHQEDKSMDHFRAMVLHTADLANPAKSLHVALAWSERLLKEFFNQGDEERRLGLPVSPMCDRDTVNVPGSQIGFIDFIVQPTFKAISLLSPRVEQVCLRGAALTKQTWETRKQANHQKQELSR